MMSGGYALIMVGGLEYVNFGPARFDSYKVNEMNPKHAGGIYQCDR